MENERCPMCGSPVKVVGNTTKHYEPIKKIDHCINCCWWGDTVFIGHLDKKIKCSSQDCNNANVPKSKGVLFNKNFGCIYFEPKNITEGKS